MVHVNGIVNLNKACERANDKATTTLVVDLCDLLLLILVELVRNWPDPSVALEHLEFEFRVQDENCDLALVLSLGLGSSANDEVRAALVLLYSQ